MDKLPGRTLIKFDITAVGAGQPPTELDGILMAAVYGDDWQSNPKALRAIADNEGRMLAVIRRSE